MCPSEPLGSALPGILINPYQPHPNFSTAADPVVITLVIRDQDILLYSGSSRSQQRDCAPLRLRADAAPCLVSPPCHHHAILRILAITGAALLWIIWILTARLPFRSALYGHSRSLAIIIRSGDQRNFGSYDPYGYSALRLRSVPSPSRSPSLRSVAGLSAFVSLRR